MSTVILAALMAHLTPIFGLCSWRSHGM